MIHGSYQHPNSKSCIKKISKVSEPSWIGIYSPPSMLALQWSQHQEALHTSENGCWTGTQLLIFLRNLLGAQSGCCGNVCKSWTPHVCALRPRSSGCHSRAPGRQDLVLKQLCREFSFKDWRQIVRALVLTWHVMHLLWKALLSAEKTWNFCANRG